MSHKHPRARQPSSRSSAQNWLHGTRLLAGAAPCPSPARPASAPRASSSSMHRAARFSPWRRFAAWRRAAGARAVALWLFLVAEPAKTSLETRRRQVSRGAATLAAAEAPLAPRSRRVCCAAATLPAASLRRRQIAPSRHNATTSAAANLARPGGTSSGVRDMERVRCSSQGRRGTVQRAVTQPIPRAGAGHARGTRCGKTNATLALGQESVRNGRAQPRRRGLARVSLCGLLRQPSEPSTFGRVQRSACAHDRSRSSRTKAC